MSVQEFLQDQHVRFRCVHHDPTFTAQEMAHTLHIPGDHVTKTVVLEADGKYVLGVVPATHCIDMHLAGKALGAQTLKLALEQDLSKICNDCQPGAIPPFGSRYGLRTLVEESLTHEEYLVFQGSSHDETLCMRYRDFEALEEPEVASFSVHS